MAISSPGASSPLKAWVRALEATAPLAQQPGLSFAVLLEELAVRFGEAPALLNEHECLTYRSLAERIGRIARWGLAQGWKRGDVVCLLLPNCPDYMALWLGLNRIGVVVALVNPNLLGDSLVHALEVVTPVAILVGDEYRNAFDAIRDRLREAPVVWSHGTVGPHAWRLDLALLQYSPGALPVAEAPRPEGADLALYIYTSGTTGLPKAARVSHRRILEWTHWFAGMMDIQPDDRMYNCLPMYHSIGGVVAMGAPLVRGASVVVRRRFSASQFWDEVVRWDCTLFQYIGELCRFLVNTPAVPAERQHRLRLCSGNGLRPDVWETFRRRFGIPQILEYYAATEANFSLYNCEEKPGAIGRIPPFLQHRFPVALVRYDVDADALVISPEGHCVRCAVDEPGEAISRIAVGKTGAASAFEGYTDATASAKKVLHNVFVAGDTWYRTGDLLRRDAAGFFYFVDRVGDTFRWKGENVSTTEVAEVIAGCRGVAQALVYGVRVSGQEGRAGMAALVVNDDFALGAFREHLTKSLPDYARPLFLRLLEAFDLTATFKPKKQELVRQGFDPAQIADPLFVDDRSVGAYVPLTAERFRAIDQPESGVASDPG